MSRRPTGVAFVLMGFVSCPSLFSSFSLCSRSLSLYQVIWDGLKCDDDWHRCSRINKRLLFCLSLSLNTLLSTQLLQDSPFKSTLKHCMIGKWTLYPPQALSLPLLWLPTLFFHCRRHPTLTLPPRLSSTSSLSQMQDQAHQQQWSDFFPLSFDGHSLDSYARVYS